MISSLNSQLNYIYKDPFLKLDHIYKFSGLGHGHIFGGATTEPSLGGKEKKRLLRTHFSYFHIILRSAADLFPQHPLSSHAEGHLHIPVMLWGGA